MESRVKGGWVGIVSFLYALVDFSCKGFSVEFPEGFFVFPFWSLATQPGISTCSIVMYVRIGKTK